MTKRNSFILSKTSRPLAFLPALAFVLSTLHSHSAWAYSVYATTLGGVMCNVASNLVPFIHLFDAIAFTAGILFAISGINELRMHTVDPSKNVLRGAFAHLFASCACLSLPGFIWALRRSLFGDGGANGLTICIPGSSVGVGGGFTGGGGSGGLDVLVENFVYDIAEPLLLLLSAIGVVAGVYLIVRGLFKAAKYGTDPKTNSVAAILANFVIGAILISSGDMLDSVTESLFGSNIQQFTGINWMPVTTMTGGMASFNAVVAAVLLFVQLIGAISFIRGWFVIKGAVEGHGQQTIPQGITHIIGGAMAINIGGFLYLMTNTIFKGTALAGIINAG